MTTIESILIQLSNVSIVISTLLCGYIAFLVFRKLYKNSLKEKGHKPILTSLGLMFLTSSIAGIDILIHQVIHTLSNDVHVWFAIAYIIKCASIAWFVYNLKKESNRDILDIALDR